MSTKWFLATMLTPTAAIGSLLIASPASTQDQQDRKMPAPPAWIAALDTDANGTISAEELAKASESLKKLDTNDDGELDREELRPHPPRLMGMHQGRPMGMNQGRPRVGRPPHGPGAGGPGFHGPPHGPKMHDSKPDGRPHIGPGSDKSGPHRFPRPPFAKRGPEQPGRGPQDRWEPGRERAAGGGFPPRGENGANFRPGQRRFDRPNLKPREMPLQPSKPEPSGTSPSTNSSNDA